MEIERKFLIDKFPDLPIHEQYNILQFYIATNPIEVRIRSKEKDNNLSYKLTFKGKGKLSRPEYEIDINKETFNVLLSFVEQPPIYKILKTYRLANGLLLECSLVDYKTDTEFMYAEIEFETEFLASQFDKNSLSFLLNEVTYDDYYKMRNYWTRK
jgi:CYTH domain-containing protein